MRKALAKRVSAFTLAELMVSTAIAGMVMAAVFSGAMAIQRCFVAAEDYALAKSDQARLSDYMALDLRRALTVTAGTDGSTIMTLTIPDYYDGSGQPRTPAIVQYVASYGNPAVPMTIVYKKVGRSMYRQENGGSLKEIATDVADFELAIEDLGKVVKTRVTFAPRFRKTATAAARTATTVFNTTLLRNKRKDL